MSEIAFLIALLALVAANVAARVAIGHDRSSGLPPLPAEH